MSHGQFTAIILMLSIVVGLLADKPHAGPIVFIICYWACLIIEMVDEKVKGKK